MCIAEVLFSENYLDRDNNQAKWMPACTIWATTCWIASTLFKTVGHNPVSVYVSFVYLSVANWWGARVQLSYASTTWDQACNWDMLQHLNNYSQLAAASYVNLTWTSTGSCPLPLRTLLGYTVFTPWIQDRSPLSRQALREPTWCSR